MKAMGDVLANAGLVPPRPAPAGSRPDGTRCFPTGSGTTLCLSAKDLREVEVRAVVGPRGRVHQFSVCQDAQTGEPIFPPLTQPGESADDILERSAAARRLMGRCRRRERPGTSMRGFS